MLRILGIDPGTAIIGYGLIECLDGEVVCDHDYIHYDALRTDKDQRPAERLKLHYDQLSNLFRSLKPDTVVIERLFFARNVTTAIGVGQARGVIMLCAEQAGKPIFEYTPLQVKQQITGYGKAEKKTMIEMTKKILNIDHERTRNDDAWDGLAIALTHCYIAGLATRPEFIVDQTQSAKLKTQNHN